MIARPSRTFRPKPLVAMIWAGFSGLAAMPAYPQESSEAGGDTMPTVSVTAPLYQSSPKATAPLVDTPQTVIVIPEKIYSEQGAQNLTDVLRNTPGISFNAGENGFATSTSSFSLRGFDASGSIFIDGVRDSGNYSRDIFNVEQVEVVEGAAADNGRSSAGGYVNMVTKTPKPVDAYSGTLSYGFDGTGADNRMRGTADLNKTFGESAALRLNLLWQDGGVPGREVAEQQAMGIAPSLAFGLNTDTRLILAYQHTKQEDLPDWGVPAAMIPGMMRFDPVASTASLDNFYGLRSDYDDTVTDSVLGRIEHDFSEALKLSNQTRWSYTERDALYTVPTGYTSATQLVATQRQAYYRENESLSNLTNLTIHFDTGALKHTVATGLELVRETSFANRYPTNGVLGNPGSTNIFTPDPDRPLAGFVGAIPTQTANVEIDTVAAYAYDTLELSPRWQITGGVRVERYTVDIESRTAAGAPQGPDGFTVSETTLGGKLGVVFKPAANGAIYAAWGTASVPPGSYLSNPDISREGDNAFPGWTGQNHQDAKLQRQTNYEIGTKWDFFDNRLATTVALFRTDRENVAMGPSIAAPVGYGEQSVQGIQIGIDGTITPAWTVFGGVMFLKSERTHGPEVDAALRAANPADYGTATTTSGDELAFTPEITANLWTTYRFPIGLTIGGGVQYVDETWVGRPDTADRVIKNGVAGKVPDYTVFNAMVAYEATRHVTIRLNVDNITDEDYVVSTNWSAQRVLLGAPRSALLSADIAF